MNYWLMKSEPSTFSIDDLEQRPNQTEPWNGVRNYQARNMMRDGMKLGDLVFFYHSNCKEVGIVGIMAVVKTAYPDNTDVNDSSWVMVDVGFIRKLKRTITLTELKTKPELTDFKLLQRGNRLSIMPVTEAQWQFILSLE
ncbi:hypothetical protein DOJK_01479 [Patescibacteria group bacterium]|nr:hypothetical protein DOJK_01479 [Patescibacteria group bacterium]